MKSTYVDPDTGDVVCPECGARNQFTTKRTAKAKWMSTPVIVAMGAMPKRLSCNGCGANLKRGGGYAPPPSVEDPDPAVRRNCPSCGRLIEANASTCPFCKARVTPPATGETLGPPLVGDAAWDTLVPRVKTLGLYEKVSSGRRLLVRSDDETTVARYNQVNASLGVKVKDADARERVLAVEGAVEDSQMQWYINVPHARHREWEALVALAVGQNPIELHPSVESPLQPEPAGSATTMTSELERLAELHARGGLTEEEFQRAKARVLGAE